ncbi:unnamed protein product, partial [Owenia fusiformis]
MAFEGRDTIDEEDSPKDLEPDAVKFDYAGKEQQIHETVEKELKSSIFSAELQQSIDQLSPDKKSFFFDQTIEEDSQYTATKTETTTSEREDALQESSTFETHSKTVIEAVTRSETIEVESIMTRTEIGFEPIDSVPEQPVRVDIDCDAMLMSQDQPYVEQEYEQKEPVVVHGDFKAHEHADEVEEQLEIEETSVQVPVYDKQEYEEPETAVEDEDAKVKEIHHDNKVKDQLEIEESSIQVPVYDKQMYEESEPVIKIEDAKDKDIKFDDRIEDQLVGEQSSDEIPPYDPQEHVEPEPASEIEVVKYQDKGHEDEELEIEEFSNKVPICDKQGYEGQEPVVKVEHDEEDQLEVLESKSPVFIHIDQDQQEPEKVVDAENAGNDDTKYDKVKEQFEIEASTSPKYDHREHGVHIDQGMGDDGIAQGEMLDKIVDVFTISKASEGEQSTVKDVESSPMDSSSGLEEHRDTKEVSDGDISDESLSDNQQQYLESSIQESMELMAQQSVHVSDDLKIVSDSADGESEDSAYGVDPEIDVVYSSDDDDNMVVDMTHPRREHRKSHEILTDQSRPQFEGELVESYTISTEVRTERTSTSEVIETSPDGTEQRIFGLVHHKPPTIKLSSDESFEETEIKIDNEPIVPMVHMDQPNIVITSASKEELTEDIEEEYIIIESSEVESEPVVFDEPKDDEELTPEKVEDKPVSDQLDARTEITVEVKEDKSFSDTKETYLIETHEIIEDMKDTKLEHKAEILQSYDDQKTEDDERYVPHIEDTVVVESDVVKDDKCKIVDKQYEEKVDASEMLEHEPKGISERIPSESYVNDKDEFHRESESKSDYVHEGVDFFKESQTAVQIGEEDMSFRHEEVTEKAIDQHEEPSDETVTAEIDTSINDVIEESDVPYTDTLSSVPPDIIEIMEDDDTPTEPFEGIVLDPTGTVKEPFEEIQETYQHEVVESILESRSHDIPIGHDVADAHLNVFRIGGTGYVVSDSEESTSPRPVKSDTTSFDFGDKAIKSDSSLTYSPKYSPKRPLSDSFDFPPQKTLSQDSSIDGSYATAHSTMSLDSRSSVSAETLTSSYASADSSIESRGVSSETLTGSVSGSGYITADAFTSSDSFDTGKSSSADDHDYSSDESPQITQIDKTPTDDIIPEDIFDQEIEAFERESENQEESPEEIFHLEIDKHLEEEQKPVCLRTVSIDSEELSTSYSSGGNEMKEEMQTEIPTTTVPLNIQLQQEYDEEESKLDAEIREAEESNVEIEVTDTTIGSPELIVKPVEYEVQVEKLETEKEQHLFSPKKDVTFEFSQDYSDFIQSSKLEEGAIIKDDSIDLPKTTNSCSISSEDLIASSTSSENMTEPTLLAATYNLDSATVSHVVATYDISPDSVERQPVAEPQPKMILSSPEDEVFEFEVRDRKFDEETPERLRLQATKSSDISLSESDTTETHPRSSIPSIPSVPEFELPSDKQENITLETSVKLEFLESESELGETVDEMSKPPIEFTVDQEDGTEEMEEIKPVKEYTAAEASIEFDSSMEPSRSSPFEIVASEQSDQTEVSLQLGQEVTKVEDLEQVGTHSRDSPFEVVTADIDDSQINKDVAIDDKDDLVKKPKDEATRTSPFEVVSPSEFEDYAEYMIAMEHAQKISDELLQSVAGISASQIGAEQKDATHPPERISISSFEHSSPISSEPSPFEKHPTEQIPDFYLKEDEFKPTSHAEDLQIEQIPDFSLKEDEPKPYIFPERDSFETKADVMLIDPFSTSNGPTEVEYSPAIDDGIMSSTPESTGRPLSPTDYILQAESSRASSIGDLLDDSRSEIRIEEETPIQIEVEQSEGPFQADVIEQPTHAEPERTEQRSTVTTDEPTLLTESLMEELHKSDQEGMLTSDQTLYDMEMPSEETSPHPSQLMDMNTSQITDTSDQFQESSQSPESDEKDEYDQVIDSPNKHVLDKQPIKVEEDDIHETDAGIIRLKRSPEPSPIVEKEVIFPPTGPVVAVTEVTSEQAEDLLLTTTEPDRDLVYESTEQEMPYTVVTDVPPEYCADIL